MLPYYGVNLLRSLHEYYLPRYQLAVERGYDRPQHRYNWLFRELQERVGVLQKSISFLDALPHFMTSDNGEQSMQYAVYFTSSFLSNEILSGTAADRLSKSGAFKTYYTAWRSALERFGTDYNTGNLPVYFLDLSEYVVHSVRLYLIRREVNTCSIDKGKLDSLLSSCSSLPKAM